jgi:hypothetical protein
MSVVQRCPNCGTTRATSGECEACHEAQVRFFCENHTPGLWLEKGTSPECGARFGDAPRSSASPPGASAGRARSTAPVPARAKPTRPTAPAGRPAPTSDPRAPHLRAGRPSTDLGAWTRTPPTTSDERAERAPRMAPWQRLLLAALRARYRPTSVARDRERAPIRGGAGGCLRRLLLMVVLLFVALASAAFLFGQALLRP